MIKTHDITGLKYLCVTTRKNWKAYQGSGIYWQRHLKKHGYDFTTELLYETDDYEDFLEQCLYYSALYDVVLNEEFANLVPETAYEFDNRILFWRYASEEIKQEIYKRRGITLKKNWDELKNDNEKYQERCNKLSETINEYWAAKTLEERRKLVEPFLKGLRKFFDEKGEKYLKWKENVSNASRYRWANISEEKRKEFGKAVSSGRLNMTPEAKTLRAERIRESFSKSEKLKQHANRMKTERLGKGNPGAIITVWENKEYSQKEFNNLVKENGWTKEFINEKFETDETCIPPIPFKRKESKIISCPYCGKSGEENNTGFRRWHFENCKRK